MKLAKILLVIAIIGFIASVADSVSFIKANDADIITIKHLHPDSTAGDKVMLPVGKDLKNLVDIRNNLVLAGKDFIEADLSAMRIRFYKSGEVSKDFPIIVKGKEGSWGETPSGLFTIKDKHKVAFSNLGDVYMPWHMVFWGEYSIHGMPYNPDGSLSARSFSSGCLNLRTNDAKELFSLAQLGLPVFIFDNDFAKDNYNYSLTGPVRKLSGLSAESYLVADLKNGFVFGEKNSNSVLQIASLTKLMTALVSTDNFVLAYDGLHTTKVNIGEKSLLPDGEVPGLEYGERFSYFDLLYPLLISSANDAAEALALRVGEVDFIELMNERAQSLGMVNTKYFDAYGQDLGNVSSAEELYYLAQYLLNNRYWLLEISKGKVYDDFGEVYFRNLENPNIFVKNPDFIGGTLDATYSNNNNNALLLFNLKINEEIRPIVIILLNSGNSKTDTDNIMDWLQTIIADNSAKVPTNQLNVNN